MTPEMLDRISNALSRLYECEQNFRTSKSFPHAQLCLSGNETILLPSADLNEFRRHIIEDGNSCDIIDRGETHIPCKCFSVGEWLYFVVERKNICLYRANWDQVEFLDADLICLHPAGEGGDPE